MSPAKHTLHLQLVAVVIVEDGGAVLRYITLDRLDVALLHIAAPRVAVTDRLFAGALQHPRRPPWAVQQGDRVEAILAARSRGPVASASPTALVAVNGVVLELKPTGRAEYVTDRQRRLGR